MKLICQKHGQGIGAEESVKIFSEIVDQNSK